VAGTGVRTGRTVHHDICPRAAAGEGTVRDVPSDRAWRNPDPGLDVHDQDGEKKPGYNVLDADSSTSSWTWFFTRA